MVTGGWTVHGGARGGFSLHHHDSGLAVAGIRPAVETAAQRWTAGEGWTIIEHPGGASWTLPGRWDMTLRAETVDRSWVRLCMRLRNLGAFPEPILGASPLTAPGLASQTVFDRLLVVGQHMCDYSRLEPVPGDFVSHAVTGLTDAAGTAAFVVGFEDLRDCFCSITVHRGADGAGPIAARCDREGIPLDPGEALDLPPLLLGAGPSFAALMDGYALLSGTLMGARRGPAMTGFCSWYYYYDAVTEEDVRENLRTIRQLPFGSLVRYVQIDDGWNLETPGSPRRWGNWQPGARFPQGMRAAAEAIRDAGFSPGLWLAPFSVDRASRLSQEHPDWLVQGDDGPCGGETCGLDLTHPGSISFLEQTFARVFDEWGFAYVKLDYLVHGTMSGRRRDPNVTTAQAYRRALAAIRRRAGNRIMLCCGARFGPHVGIADAMRIGFDVSSRWDVRLNPSGWPAGNLNVRAAAIHTIWLQWMQGRWGRNDPDCIVVRDRGSPAERDVFRRYFPDFLEQPPYGLSTEEARCWAGLVWFTGGYAFLGDRIAELPPERLAILASCFPPNPEPPVWVDWYEDPMLVALRTRGKPCTIGIFNLTEENRAARIAARKVFEGDRRPWSLRERSGPGRLSGDGAMVSFPVQAPHSARFWVTEEP